MRKMLLFIVAGALACGGSGPTTTNLSPIVNPSAAQPSLVMGQSTGLDANARDPEGDPLTYSWTQTSPASPQGTFSSLTSATPTWTAPTVGMATAFTLTVTVSDGHSHPSPPVGVVKVFSKTSTDPSFLADIQPLLIHCFGTCHTMSDGYQPLAQYSILTTLTYDRPLPYCDGQLIAKAGDPDNSVLMKTLIGTACGPQMPPGGPYLGTDQLDLVRSWISRGALNN
jgi:hypothetical protein